MLTESPFLDLRHVDPVQGFPGRLPDGLDSLITGEEGSRDTGNQISEGDGGHSRKICASHLQQARLNRILGAGRISGFQCLLSISPVSLVFEHLFDQLDIVIEMITALLMSLLEAGIDIPHGKGLPVTLVCFLGFHGLSGGLKKLHDRLDAEDRAPGARPCHQGDGLRSLCSLQDGSGDFTCCGIGAVADDLFGMDLAFLQIRIISSGSNWLGIHGHGERRLTGAQS